MNLKIKNKIKEYKQEVENFINKLLDKDKHNIEGIKKRIELKGLSLHNEILKYLEINNEPIYYSYIKSIRIYDKRIRLILFKYISMVEEHLRSQLEKEGILIEIYDKKKKTKDNINYKHDYKIISEGQYYFSEILKKYLELTKQEYNYYKPVVDLRNDVFHNKLIVTNEKNINSIILIKDLLIDKDIEKNYINDLLKQKDKETDKHNTKIELPNCLMKKFYNKIN